MRIEISDIIEAYENINFAPTDQHYIDNKYKKCCPLSALVLVAGKLTSHQYERKLQGLDRWGTVCFLASHLGLDPSYVLGFSASYDGYEQAEILDQFVSHEVDLDAFSDGYEDGQTASILCAG